MGTTTTPQQQLQQLQLQHTDPDTCTQLHPSSPCGPRFAGLYAQPLLLNTLLQQYTDATMRYPISRACTAAVSTHCSHLNKDKSMPVLCETPLQQMSNSSLDQIDCVRALESTQCGFLDPSQFHAFCAINTTEACCLNQPEELRRRQEPVLTSAGSPGGISASNTDRPSAIVMTTAGPDTAPIPAPAAPAAATPTISLGSTTPSSLNPMVIVLSSLVALVLILVVIGCCWNMKRVTDRSKQDESDLEEQPQVELVYSSRNINWSSQHPSDMKMDSMKEKDRSHLFHTPPPSTQISTAPTTAMSSAATRVGYPAEAAALTPSARRKRSNPTISHRSFSFSSSNRFSVGELKRLSHWSNGRKSRGTIKSGSGASAESARIIRAKWAHVPEHEDELTIQAGEDVFVEDTFDDGWGYGMNLATGRRGFFQLVGWESPGGSVESVKRHSSVLVGGSNRASTVASRKLSKISKRTTSSSVKLEQLFSELSAGLDAMKKVQQTVPAVPVPVPAVSQAGTVQKVGSFGVIMRVMHPYAATMQDELSLVVGNDVIMLTAFEDGWAMGLEPMKGLKGVFPLACVVKVEEAHTLAGF
ncbi:hypothetical protein CcCBS67573_g04472 [Chytriomyces confervae]|uniref:SH3 domain-containing protein n=1 Tax=Chytriomyces confervae TaxID=246404 RepID=A0A507FDN8_9FUNG|nr:hypothetical protein HDU80_004470 [Chytriomyces hyalinus]TPX74252.1 hypothetical protein CcCBS67573_g04472 [Chytriomyces confervae]